MDYNHERLPDTNVTNLEATVLDAGAGTQYKNMTTSAMAAASVFLSFSVCEWKYWITCGVLVVLSCTLLFVLSQHVCFLLGQELRVSRQWWWFLRQQREHQQRHNDNDDYQEVKVPGVVVRRKDVIDSLTSNSTILTVECCIDGTVSQRTFWYPWREGRRFKVGQAVDCIHLAGDPPTAWQRVQDVGRVWSIFQVVACVFVLILASFFLVASPVAFYETMNCEQWTAATMASCLIPLTIISAVALARLRALILKQQDDIQFAKVPTTGINGDDNYNDGDCGDTKHSIATRAITSGTNTDAGGQKREQHQQQKMLVVYEFKPRKPRGKEEEDCVEVVYEFAPKVADNNASSGRGYHQARGIRQATGSWAQL